MSFNQAELVDFAVNLFVNYDEGFEGDAPLTDETIARMEEGLGYSLPIDYIALMRQKNGSSLKRCFFRYTDMDGYECELMVRGIYGVGFTNNNALCGEMDSRSLEDPKNHVLPHIGVYLAEEDSGHGLFALDYHNINADGEPPVINIYLDNFHEECITDSFADFVRRLTADKWVERISSQDFKYSCYR